MKYKTLKSIIKVAKKEYERTSKFDQKLQNVLNFDNGDCYIVTGTPVIDDMLKIIIDEYPDEKEWIEWFFYDKYLDGLDKNETFTVDNVKYKLTIKNFYKFIKRCKNDN